MKSKKKYFAQQYPYLSFWRDEWAEMETTDGAYGQARIRLMDEGGTCYEDYKSKSQEEALQKAEKYVREVEAKRCFDKETIAELEAEYIENNLS
jgi:hypothetical protein